MSARDLLAQSKDLTGHSLESFIVDTTSEGQNHNFHSLLSHPNINTIEPRYKQMVRLFSQGTYEHYQQYQKQHQPLNPKQVGTLKKLTLLSQFRGKNTVSLLMLEQRTKNSQQQLLGMLMKMSIDGTITIKIDQQNNQMTIYHSELRAFPLTNEITTAIASKIAHIQQKNNRLGKQLRDINNQKSMEPDEREIQMCEQ